jgi:hypothetical protein
MPVHSTVEAADRPVAEPLLLTIGRAGVLSWRAIAAGELEPLLSLLGPLSERQPFSVIISSAQDPSYRVAACAAAAPCAILSNSALVLA